MERRRVEQGAKTSGNTALSEVGGAISGAVVARAAESPPDLVEVIAVWPFCQKGVAQSHVGSKDGPHRRFGVGDLGPSSPRPRGRQQGSTHGSGRRPERLSTRPQSRQHAGPSSFLPIATSTPPTISHTPWRGPKPLQLKRQPTAWPEMGVGTTSSMIELDQHRVVTQRGGRIKPMVKVQPASRFRLSIAAGRAAKQPGERPPRGLAVAFLGPADGSGRRARSAGPPPRHDPRCLPAGSPRPTTGRPFSKCRPARAASPNDSLPLVRNLKSAHDRNRPKGRGQAYSAGPPSA